MPIRNIPEINGNNPSPSLGSIAIIGCDQSLENDSHFDITCKMQSEQLEYALQETGLFSDIVTEKEKADYHVFIKNSTEKPYHYGIGHNPGILLLSLVIPFWENYAT